MDDIREKLDKIKIAIADEGKDLTLYTAEQLSGWIKIQYTVGQDIKDVLSHMGDSTQDKDRAHRIRPLFHEYTQNYELMEMQIDKHEKIKDEQIEEIDKIRKRLIEVINSFNEMGGPWLKNMKEQFLPIIEKLEATTINKDDPNFLATLKLQKEIGDTIYEINHNGTIPDSTQYRDRIHRLNGQVYKYFGACSCLVHWIEEEMSVDDDGRNEILTMVNESKPELIKILGSLNNITVNLKEKTGMEDIISYIRTKFTDGEVDIDDDVHILCSNRVFKAIIDELRENYRKYGTDGYISIKTSDNVLTISLQNKKKEKDENDFSSGTGSKIFAEYMKELGGTYTSDYSTENCITTICLPIYTSQ